MNVAIYLRCSTDIQDESIDVQRQLCRDYCTSNDHNIVAEYVDEGVTGGLECARRPGASKMLQDSRDKLFQGIVARSNRRLGRDTIDLLCIRKEAKKRKLALLFVTQTFGDDAQGDFMWTLMAATGELERKLTGERIRNHNRHLATIGRWASGTPPLGFLYDPEAKTLQVDPDRAQDAVKVFETFLNTRGNCSETAKRLNMLDVKTGRGRQWSDSTVNGFIRNPLFRGILRYQEIETKVDLPEIVPVSILERVDRILCNTRNIRKRNPKRVFPFSGLLVCGKCGVTYKAHQSYKGKLAYTYVCRGHKERGICDAKSISSARVDKLVQEGLGKALQAEADHIHSIKLKESSGKAHTKQDVVFRRLRELKDSRSRLIDLYIAKIITKDELDDKLHLLDEEVKQCEVNMHREYISMDEIMQLLKSWSDTWTNWTAEDKRAFLLMMVSRIVIWITGKSAKIDIYTNLREGIVTVSE